MFHCHRLVTPYHRTVQLNCGALFHVNLTDNIQRQIYFQGEYEPEVTHLMRTILSEGDTFIDIGANVGYHTVLAKELVGSSGSVHSFEPLPKLYSELNRNVQLNSYTNVFLNQIALHREKANINIYLPGTGNNGTGSIFERDHHTGGSLSCPAISLDMYLRSRYVKNLRLIKIDIEGGEIYALEGMSTLLNRTPAPNLILEVIPELQKNTSNSRKSIYSILGSFGYQNSPIDKSNVYFYKSGDQ